MRWKNVEGRSSIHLPYHSQLSTPQSVFLYTEDEAPSNVTHAFPLVLQHTFAIHREFSLEISQLASSSAENVLDDTPEMKHPPSPAGW